MTDRVTDRVTGRMTVRVTGAGAREPKALPDPPGPPALPAGHARRAEWPRPLWYLPL